MAWKVEMFCKIHYDNRNTLERRKRNMEFQVGVIAGDGIGPEVVAEAQKVLNKVGEVFGHRFHYEAILNCIH